MTLDGLIVELERETLRTHEAFIVTLIFRDGEWWVLCQYMHADDGEWSVTRHTPHATRESAMAILTNDVQEKLDEGFGETHRATLTARQENSAPMAPVLLPPTREPVSMDGLASLGNGSALVL